MVKCHLLRYFMKNAFSNIMQMRCIKTGTERLMPHKTSEYHQETPTSRTTDQFIPIRKRDTKTDKQVTHIKKTSVIEKATIFLTEMATKLEKT